MGRTKLFDNWTWRRNLSDPFKSTAKKRTDVWSAYNTAAERKSTLHAPTLCGILAYMDIDKQNPSAKGAVGTRGNTVVAEYPSHRAGETHVCVYNRDTGKFTAGKFSGVSTSTPEPYEMKSRGDGQSGSVLFFTLMPVFLEDQEFADEYRRLKQHRDSGWSMDTDDRAKTAAVLCDNIYRRIENAVSISDAGIKVDIPASGNIQPLNVLTLNKNEYSPTRVIAGTFEILTPVSEPSAPKEIVENADFTGKYSLSERTFTDAERQMIPELQDWYVIPPEVVQICKHAKMTTEATLRMRNFMLRGPSGTGKTKGAEATAAGFGLPYVYITCSANTEITDLLGQILPDVKTGSDNRVEQSVSGSIIPAYEDIQMDPATAYCTLTGEYIEDITADAVYGKLIEMIQNNAVNPQNDGGRQGCRYIDTPLVDAIRYGWVCEIQEPSIIANPGVLVGLNALLDTCGTVTLPTGEVIQRHPDTVIIVTTNDDYNGCKKMNQSVVSRMDLLFDVDEPDIDTLVERVMKITKCTDESMVRRMAETVKDISKHCRQEMITDGCCGVRELISWVQSYMISGSALESAGFTILPSVSANPENRADIRTKCLDAKYAA